MATIIRQVHIDTPPAEVWAALSDFAALHERLAPGFVVDLRMDGPETRTVTFFNGMVAREVLIGVDEDSRRLAYTAVEGGPPATHYNASAQVSEEGSNRSRFVWIIDVLPHDLATAVGDLMDRGIAVIRQTLESPSGATAEDNRATTS